MIAAKWDVAVFVFLTIVVSVVVGYKVYDSGMFRSRQTERSSIEDELEWASVIEGARIQDLVTIDPNASLRIREAREPRRGRFMLIFGDSLCKPCFGNLLREFVTSLRENDCAFDPTQWEGVFVGSNTVLGESTFRGVFGRRAAYVSKAAMNGRFIANNDGLVVFVTRDNTVLAACKIARGLPKLRSSFIKRAANALHSDSS